ncbi:MAG: sigma-70 family RNA polymerase sigma factor [Planctomycetales bacterium]|nr:sigma-70 family RNA polymerase sigma factor [Planctomycetales bacterium]
MIDSRDGGYAPPPNPFVDVTDEALVKLVAGRNEDALDELIRRHAGHVMGLCRRICFDEHDVNALVSDVFWELWGRADKYDGTRSSVRTYLLTIARCRAIDRRRSATARQRLFAAQGGTTNYAQSVAAPVDQPFAQSLQLEKAEHVQKALEQLPAPQQAAIKLAFFHGLTHEEVAQRLQMPLGTIKTRIRTGLIQLRKALAEYQYARDF